MFNHQLSSDWRYLWKNYSKGRNSHIVFLWLLDKITGHMTYIHKLCPLEVIELTETTSSVGLMENISLDVGWSCSRSDSNKIGILNIWFFCKKQEICHWPVSKSNPLKPEKTQPSPPLAGCFFPHQPHSTTTTLYPTSNTAGNHHPPQPTRGHRPPWGSCTAPLGLRPHPRHRPARTNPCPQRPTIVYPPAFFLGPGNLRSFFAKKSGKV